jgi:hypothetical protein
MADDAAVAGAAENWWHRVTNELLSILRRAGACRMADCAGLSFDRIRPRGFAPEGMRAAMPEQRFSGDA